MQTRKAVAGALGVALVAVALGYLLSGGIGQNLVYFLTPTELAARDASAAGTAVRLGGMVEPGSVSWDPDTRELRFRLTDTETTVDVRSTGAPPQMFTEGIGVIVEGSLAPSGVFLSHNVMVKHSNEYRAPETGKHPSEYYRQLFQPEQP